MGQDWSALDYSAGSATDGFEMPWNVVCINATLAQPQLLTGG